MPRNLLVTVAMTGAVVLAGPAGFALAIDEVLGVWEVRSTTIFGRTLVSATPYRVTIAISGGVPQCFINEGNGVTIPVVLEQWMSRGADQATVRLTQLAPSGEAATYAVETPDARELRFIATSGTNASQCTILAKPQPARPKPAVSRDGDAAEGPGVAAATPASTPAAKAAAASLITRLTNELGIEKKRLATAQANLQSQLEHTGGYAGGRQAEYDAVVAERRDAVRLHKERIEALEQKLDDLRGVTKPPRKEPTWKR